MIVAFGVIGLLILFLIYFVLRAQNLQKELALSRHSNKQTNNKVTYAYRNLVLVTDALEKTLLRVLKVPIKAALSTKLNTMRCTRLCATFQPLLWLVVKKACLLKSL